MARTAAQEQYGDAVDSSPGGGNYLLRLPSGVPGAVRTYLLRPTGATNVILPATAGLEPSAGGAPCYTIHNKTANSSALTVLDEVGGSTVTTLAADEAAQIFLHFDGGTATWLARKSSGIVLSGTRPNTWVEFDIALQSGTDVNLRTLCDELGYDGTTAALVRATLEVPSGATNAVIGASSVGYSYSVPGLSTGTFASGSHIVLTVGTGAFISGKGGQGGVGGSASVSPGGGAGGAGGIGLDITTSLTLINYGTIQGGGGGKSYEGRGGASVLGNAGNNYTITSGQSDATGYGGGGGAGFEASLGGAVPFGGNVAYNGGNGSLQQGGSAGGTGLAVIGNVGGAGGGAGGAGASAGGAGGAAGKSIRRLASVTYTELVAGTIHGTVEIVS